MAAARAAARRQAILSSRGNRLAKLTSSARGDDPGGVYANDDPPLPTIGGTGLENFVGEETVLPTPSPSSSPSSRPQPRAGASEADWGGAQQEEFIRALMGGAPGQTGLGIQPPFGEKTNSNADPNAPPAPKDPFSDLLASLVGGADGPFAKEAPPPPRPRNLAQKLIPVLHALGMLAILVWFVGWKEPEAFAETWNPYMDKTGENVPDPASASWWSGRDNDWVTRWARLSRSIPVGGMVVPPLPAFFWAFTTLQLALHSLRLVSQPDAYRPPMLLGLVMPYLPPPLPQTILTSLKYLQMGSLILDDLAILIFGIGLVVFVSSNWMT